MYNPYNPYMAQFQNQPITPPYQPAQPPFYPAMSQPAQPQNQAMAVMYEPTAKDFASVSIQPGRQALIIAQNEPYMAFKSADNMGMVQTTMYRIEQVTEQDISAPAPEYATKSELEQLQQVVQKIVDAIRSKGAKKEGTAE